MMHNNYWNDVPHTVSIDDLFCTDESAYGLDIPDEFEHFDSAAQWIDDACDAHGLERECFYLANEYAGGNAGNALSQGQLT